MGKIRIIRRTTRTVRKSQQKAHIKKDKKGHPTIYDTFDCRDREAESVWLVK